MLSGRKLRLEATMLAVAFIIKAKIRSSATFRAHAAKMDAVVQFRLRDKTQGRYFIFENGLMTSKRGIHPAPHFTMMFKDVDTAITLLTPPVNYAETIHAGKNFRVIAMGPDEVAAWFMTLANMITSDGWQHGTPMSDGTHRYTTMTNGGPLFVYVKDGRIVRTNIIEFDERDGGEWNIEARGRRFRPLRKAMVAPHALPMRSLVYSDKRVLYPMKRIDFDPKGARNPHNRGKSEFVRISWDEALDIVSNEILRMKRQYGPGAIAGYHSSHHQWGNVGYYLSSFMRFMNAVGMTRVAINPDSWEGWYWGAQHHHGAAMRLGSVGSYGTLEDALKECELMVYWSSDPESQYNAYAGQDATQHRLWGQELGIKTVHINPHHCPTANLLGGKWFPIRPGTDGALAVAIMYVWIAEDLYDKWFVENRTDGFAHWRAYVLGESDGVPKTPEWQESETGIPARDVRALAREWGRKKTYLAPGVAGNGFGGAARSATGTQWARMMILLQTMQGWGKPGVNFGNLSTGSPIDHEFWFPGYSEGGISGELNNTGSASNNYVRMPHLISVNPVSQVIPRQSLAEAILTGSCEGYLLEPLSLEGQFRKVTYPAPGHSKVHMLYRYGGSSFGTFMDSGRLTQMYQSGELECVVNQSIFMEGEALYADVILPACTSLERFDIGEWCGAGGFGLHYNSALNHRVIAIQHKCIEPLGESKSDYQIFWDICKKLGLGTYFSEGCTELDWAKRIFDASDISKMIRWEKFIKKGYYVVPAAEPPDRPAADMRWYYEGRPKDAPEPYPLPGCYSDRFLHGLPTQSGKIEFLPNSLRRFDELSTDRPVLPRYIPGFEGRNGGDMAQRFPLQLLTPHARYSFHTAMDGKDSAINDIQDHRIEIEGHYYWILRINPLDAAERGIAMHDLVKVFNDRGAVICAALLTEGVAHGVVHGFESCATYVPVRDGSGIVDIGGCLNILTPRRRQAVKTESMAPNSCLVEVERWKRANHEEVESYHRRREMHELQQLSAGE